MSLFDKLADVGEFFAGPEKIDLTGTLTRTADGAWALSFEQPTKLRRSQMMQIELDNPRTEISQAWEGKLVSVRGRVAAKGTQGNLVLEPDEVAPAAVAQVAASTT